MQSSNENNKRILPDEANPDSDNNSENENKQNNNEEKTNDNGIEIEGLKGSQEYLKQCVKQLNYSKVNKTKRRRKQICPNGSSPRTMNSNE